MYWWLGVQSILKKQIKMLRINVQVFRHFKRKEVIYELDSPTVKEKYFECTEEQEADLKTNKHEALSRLGSWEESSDRR
jgi:hypothetical protein